MQAGRVIATACVMAKKGNHTCICHHHNGLATVVTINNMDETLDTEGHVRTRGTAHMWSGRQGQAGWAKGRGTEMLLPPLAHCPVAGRAGAGPTRSPELNPEPRRARGPKGMGHCWLLSQAGNWMGRTPGSQVGTPCRIPALQATAPRRYSHMPDATTLVTLKHDGSQAC